MTSDAEPLSAMPFESIRPAIVSLGSVIELDDVTMLLALHDDARYHRARVRELERQVEAQRAALELNDWDRAMGLVRRALSGAIQRTEGPQ